MKKQVLSALAALGIGVGTLVGFGGEPASAHIYDSSGLVACVETNPFAGLGLAWIPDHAHPLWFNEYVIQYGCLGHAGVLQCRWEALYWVDGHVTGPYAVECG